MTATSALDPGTNQPRRRRLRPADPVLALAGGVCVALVVIALIAPLITTWSPSEVNLPSANQGPSSLHWFGTDALGRDLFARVVYGARLSLLGPALVTILATVLGTTLALVCAWRGGWTDRVISRILDILFAFPGLLLAVVSVVAFGVGLTAPVVALSISYTPYIARVVRGVAVRERQLPYVEACQVLGYSAWRISLLHILRNIRLFIVAQATITFGYALLDLASISFIGLGVQPPTAEWGLMVSDGGSALLNGNPQESYAAGAAIVLAVVAFNVLGERFSARSEPDR